MSETDTTFRYAYVYDGMGHKVLETVYYQQSTDWSRYKQTEYQFIGAVCVRQTESVFDQLVWRQRYVIDYGYENGAVVTELHTLWNGLESTPFQKITFGYTASNLTSKMIYRWEQGVWKLSESSASTYFEDGRLQIKETTVYQADTISVLYKSEFTYDGSLRLIQEGFSQKSPGGLSWLTLETTNWLYLQNSSTVVSQRSKKWVPELLKWENTQKIDYAYNISNNLISATYQSWSLMFWNDLLKYSYEYNESGALVKTQLLSSIFKQWRNIRHISYGNLNSDAANLLESTSDFWGGIPGDAVVSDLPFSFNNELSTKRAKRIEISRSFYTAIVTPTGSQPSHPIQVYPNPSDGVFYINTFQNPMLYWEIYHPNGRVLKRSDNARLSNVVDLTELDPGVYFVRVVCNTTSQTQKLIKN